MTSHVAATSVQSCPEDLQHSRESSCVSLATVAVTESYQPLPIAATTTTKDGAALDAADAKASTAAADAKQPSSQRSPRIDTAAIDGIRTIACVTIATNHWLQWFGEKKHGSIELQVRTNEEPKK